MYFNTGDIITATIYGLPFFLHQGIIVVEDYRVNVFHNTPTKKNITGGNIIEEDFSDWIKGRYIINIEHTGMTKEYIESSSHELSYLPFNIISFNCEKYVSLLKNGWEKSYYL